jgi:uncharacterized protein YueI
MNSKYGIISDAHVIIDINHNLTLDNAITTNHINIKVQMRKHDLV